eukprot:CAMPEP_0202687796 /NCGR_PEP_ID=MMETSP1385-20130828/3406_1 /ASSEMBLY_ACC=CAM_ASM_000861 /TAXON_ID=933848 /ORGANISM="Elphidium margaritaceum" /LENGTH=369 /DNA_ID=CAMNT_0049342643 /DNA_START=79 /DNA_END=1188 /DNA_ORIENTATION=+
MMKSPTHIFDSNVYAQWTEGDKEKIDLHKNESKSATTKDTEEKEPSSEIALSEAQTFSIEYEQGIFTMKWSPDGQYLAVGCADGCVRVLRGSDGKLEHKLSTSGSQPVTSMRWKPSLSNVGSSSCLITTSSSGCIDIWHVQSSKCMYSINEEDNQIFCFDLSPSIQGSFKFAAAGKDRTIRIYDDETKKLTCSLEKGFMSKQVGHSNRIFSLKWKPDDPNILLSGGWDNSVLFWDLRSKSCFRSIFGPHIAGQTIDIQNDIVVTGSWSIRDTINLYEFSTGKPVQKQKILWDPSPMIYSLSYSPTLEGVIAAGGSGLNCARIINTNTGQKSDAIRLTNGAGVYCLDWEPKGNVVAVAGNSADITLVTIK